MDQKSEKNSWRRTGAWLAGSFLLAVGVALFATWSYPAAGELPLPKQQASAPQVPTSAAPVKAETDALTKFDERMKEVENAQKALYQSWIDGQRKTIDWWLAFLAVMTAVFALGGALIPYLMGRKDRELVEIALRDANRAAEEARRHLTNIQQHEDRAKAGVEAIEQLKNAQAGGEKTPENEEALQAAVQSVKQNPQANPVDKLRAEALQAGQEKKSEKAYQLWAAVTALESNDARAAFNAGYWAQQLYEAAARESKVYWLQKVESHYAQALTIKADYHQAANNWGVALAVEARAVAGSDLAAARGLWRRAGEKYAQALTIKADKHEAANNWGNALNVEARVVADNDLAAARGLWRRAGEKYAQALTIKADMHEAANNWGIALDAEARAVADSDLAAARGLWQRAGEKYAQALTIKADMHEVANNWGSALDAEAQAVADSDLAAARGLWRRAGEKYAQALTIKADYHEAANNLATSLLKEREKNAPLDANAARDLLKQAKEILIFRSGEAQNLVAYNLACCFALEGDADSAVEWLKVSQKGGALPTKQHIQDDRDFDLIRDKEPFVSWFNDLKD